MEKHSLLLRTCVLYTIRECVSLMAVLKFSYFLITGIMFMKSNRGTSLIGDVFISYDP